MKIKNIAKANGSGESTTLEWKQSLAETDEIIETAAAFANTKGGKILVGISPEGKVLGVQIGKGTVENLVNQIALKTDPKLHPMVAVRKNGGKEVILIDVKESHDHLSLAFGRAYKRVGRSTVKMTKDEYERLILEKHKDKLYFDERVCKGAKITDISKEKIFSFVRRAKEQRGLGIDPGVPITDILKKLRLMKDGKLTNAAILLFGKDPQSFFLQAELKAIRFKGIDETKPMLDFKTIGGDAITLLGKAESFIYDHIPMKAWIESGKLERQEKWLYPPDAIREALANALAHRDYASPGKVQVRIFDDRLEIWNPGLLSPPLTVEKLKKKHDSFPRNPLISKAFFWIRYAEDVGSGTSKIVQWCKDWGLPEPAYEEAGASFVAIFHNPNPEKAAQTSSEKSSEKGSEKSSEKIISIITKNPAISAQELAKILDLSSRAVEKHLSKLKEKGVMKRIGPDKGGHWELLR